MSDNKTFIDKVKDIFQEIVRNIKASSIIAKKQIQIKNLKFSELKKIYFNLGEYAINNKINNEVIEDYFIKIDNLDKEIQEVNLTVPIAEDATVGDKAKHAATIAKNKATSKILFVKKNKLITETGKAVEEIEINDDNIILFQKEIKEVLNNIDILEKEVEVLGNESSGIAKRPFLVLGIIIFVVIAIFLFIPNKNKTYENYSVVDTELKKFEFGNISNNFNSPIPRNQYSNKNKYVSRQNPTNNATSNLNPYESKQRNVVRSERKSKEKGIDISKEDLEDSINKYLESKTFNLLGFLDISDFASKRFPVKINKKGTVNKIYNILEDSDLLSSDSYDNFIEYSLTDDGQELIDESMKKRSSKEFAIGSYKVDKIIRFSRPRKKDKLISINVTYSSVVDNIPSNIEIDDLISANKYFDDLKKAEENNATLILTEKGWVHERLFYK